MGATLPTVISAPPRDIVEPVRRFAQAERIFRRTAHVVVAVSGGADSVAALLAISDLAGVFGFEVSACHFDHQLRNSGADEREWVRALCSVIGVSCVTGEGDVRALAKDRRLSVEAAARTMRYDFLAFAAEKLRADCVATGHTADDQAETVLLRMLRGTGVRGLRGILPAGPIPGHPTQRLVRPLLTLRRSETTRLCRDAGIEPLVDASNDDVRFARNRIRHEVLPVLRRMNPSVDKSLVNLATHARDLFREVERAADATVPVERGEFGSIFSALDFRTLPAEARTLVVEREAAFWKLPVETNRTTVANLASVLTRGSGLVRFGATEVEVSAGMVRIGPHSGRVDIFPSTILNVPGITSAGPWQVEVRTEQFSVVERGTLDLILESPPKGVLRIYPPTGKQRPRLTPEWAATKTPTITDGHVTAMALQIRKQAPTEPEPALFVRLRRKSD